MPLVSYAQNGEDVVLHRALKDVKEGHYIDVGAHDPETHSVTKIFYDRGWSGINVEASKSCFDRLAVGRPRDRNLHVAVAARAGVMSFHEVDDTGLSTLDLAAAADAERRGFAVSVVDVPSLSLADICRDLPFDATHFLKIDVEGAERDVLHGADFESFRPWIVVVEATRPNSTTRVDANWREILDRAGYECTLFDGLNLYFLAQEQAHLRDALSAPANVFDDFLPVRVAQLTERDGAAAEEISRLGREIERRDAEQAANIAQSAAEAASLTSERDAAAVVLMAERDAVASTLSAEREAAAVVLTAERDAAASALTAERGAAAVALTAEREAGTAASADDHARLIRLTSERDVLDRSLKQVADDLIEARISLRTVTSTLERELGSVRRQAGIDAEHHFAELSDAREQLARLAHFRARSDRLQQISDLTNSGSHLADRGAEVLDLRAGLLRQAWAWQEEVRHLEGRLRDALEGAALLHRSTSWRITSPLRGLRRATHVLRREPHRLPALMRQRARELVRRSETGEVADDLAGEAGQLVMETGTQAILSVAASLDKEMSLIADLLASVSSVLIEDKSAAGPSYNEARLDERLTHWILSDVARQRQAAL